MKFAQNIHPTRLFGPTCLIGTWEYKIFLPETCDFPLAPLLEDPSVSDENDDSEAAIVAIFYIRKFVKLQQVTVSQ